jgi:cytochrome bd-type quinol oxidase subunit 1
MVLTSLLGYVLIYTLLIVATIYLLRKYAIAGPEGAEVAAQDQPDQMPSLVSAQD